MILEQIVKEKLYQLLKLDIIQKLDLDPHKKNLITGSIIKKLENNKAIVKINNLKLIATVDQALKENKTFKGVATLENSILKIVLDNETDLKYQNLQIDIDKIQESQKPSLVRSLQTLNNLARMIKSNPLLAETIDIKAIERLLGKIIHIDKISYTELKKAILNSGIFFERNLVENISKLEGNIENLTKEDFKAALIKLNETLTVKKVADQQKTMPLLKEFQESVKIKSLIQNGLKAIEENQIFNISGKSENKESIKTIYPALINLPLLEENKIRSVKILLEEKTSENEKDKTTISIVTELSNTGSIKIELVKNQTDLKASIYIEKTTALKKAKKLIPKLEENLLKHYQSVELKIAKLEKLEKTDQEKEENYIQDNLRIVNIRI